MDLFKGTIYRQTMFAEFEKSIYEDVEQDIPLTADYLNKKYYELNKKLFLGWTICTTTAFQISDVSFLGKTYMHSAGRTTV